MRLLPVLLLLASPALAQEKPIFLPTRDVAVTYKVTGGAAQGQELKLAWLLSEKKLRVEPPGVGWGILDLGSKRLTMVHEGTKSTVDLPADALPGGLRLPTEPPPGTQFTRAGTEKIAGVACTVWRYDGDRGQGEACMTTDGVMLRSSGRSSGQSGGMQATAVSYARQDPARFRPPADYKPLSLPPGLRLAPGPAR